MSTITSLTSGMNGATSLTTINTDFTNLNTDKYQSGSLPTFGSTQIITNGFGQLNLGRRTDASTVSALLTFDTSTASGVWSAQNNAGILTFNIGGTVGSAIGSPRLEFSLTGNTVIGAQQAVSTSATDGFIYIPTCTGTPTGVPTVYTGKCAMIMDTTNHKLYVYDGSWLAMN